MSNHTSNFLNNLSSQFSSNILAAFLACRAAILTPALMSGIALRANSPKNEPMPFPY